MNAMLDADKPAENRTFVGSIVFIDIVDYSRKTVAEQILIRERFKALISASLETIDPELRLVLDTGDGAAISFLGDVKDALTVSVRMRDFLRLANGAPIKEAATANLNRTIPIFNYALRIGVNLGPVKLQQDSHGHPQIVGDGINVAQRITSFAKADQIVVSQSYFDAISTIAPEYAKLLTYEGARTDKNVREHEIYAVADSAALNQAAHPANSNKKIPTRALDAEHTNNKDIKTAGSNDKRGNPRSDDNRERTSKADSSKADTSRSSSEKRASNVVAPIPFMQDRNKLLLTGSILAFVVAGLFVVMAIRKPSSRVLPKYENVPEDVSAIAPKVAPTLAEPTTSAATIPAVASETQSIAQPPPQTASTTASGTVVPPTVPTAATTDSASAELAKTITKPVVKPIVATGFISFSIQPWGDVYVNGRSVGASPPLKQSKLAPGTYRVEIKNTTFPPYVTTVDVTSKETVSVKHRFQ
jgi:class 3 adenylate cyclase